MGNQQMAYVVQSAAQKSIYYYIFMSKLYPPKGFTEIMHKHNYVHWSKTHVCKVDTKLQLAAS